jgi:GNAT superfamily N-acetyltransferase
VLDAWEPGGTPTPHFLNPPFYAASQLLLHRPKTVIIMSSEPQEHETKLRVELIERPEDIIHAFDCVCEAFGRQAQDGIFLAMNPGWETPRGKELGAARMVTRWRATTKDKDGQPNAVFLKATLPDSEQKGERIIAGFAIWVQVSSVQGYGDLPVEDLRKAMDLEALYPGNEAEQRYLYQVMASLHRRRMEIIKEKATAVPPMVMALDMCAVDPAYQRKGIARKLVQWGLDEARRRGGLEAITEASSMGRHVYEKMGFQAEGPDIEYTVDSEFESRRRPPNVFMRTHGNFV